MKKWIALFSQTGSEIVGIAQKLGYYPDVIVTNKESISNIHSDLPKDRIVQISKKPSIEEYRKVLDKEAVITLNGFLRIIPGVICEEYKIYNGHPGLITKYPFLKGKDPQAHAVALHLPTSGCILHKAVAEVDSGEIISQVEVKIAGLTTDEVVMLLRTEAVKLWVQLLRTELQ